MTGSRLAALLDQTDAPGSGLVMVGPRIFTLEQQRDMARLLMDMDEFIRANTGHSYTWDGERNVHKADCPKCALLARSAALDEKAGAA